MKTDRELLEMAREALFRLKNEAAGFLGITDQGGNTNRRILIDRINEAGEALALIDERLQADEKEKPVAWNHGCSIVGMNIDLWLPKCPNCGMPAPALRSREER